MSGHSKWSTIKHKKAATDAKKGATFTKIARFIEVAARGGADPEMNFSLKLAIQKARSVNMPQTNVEKAIRKGAGLDADKSTIEEALYEGIGPGNVAIMVSALTDNKNRTVSEVRNIFNKGGGSLGTSGSVAWQFQNKGVITADKDGDTDIELKIIDAGAEDYEDLGDAVEIYTNPKDLNVVRTALTASGVKVTEAKLAYVPTTMVKIEDANTARKILNLMETLEEEDDVAEVYSNLDIDESIMGTLNG